MITGENITDKRIRELQATLFARKLGDELELMGLVACHEAIGRGHRRGAARAQCAEIINLLANAANEVIQHTCPKCLVLAGVRCTSLNRSGYSPIRKPHPERVALAESAVRARDVARELIQKAHAKAAP